VLVTSHFARRRESCTRSFDGSCAAKSNVRLNSRIYSTSGTRSRTTDGSIGRQTSSRASGICLSGNFVSIIVNVGISRTGLAARYLLVAIAFGSSCSQIGEIVSTLWIMGGQISALLQTDCHSSRSNQIERLDAGDVAIPGAIVMRSVGHHVRRNSIAGSIEFDQRGRHIGKNGSWRWFSIAIHANISRLPSWNLTGIGVQSSSLAIDAFSV